MLARFSLSKSYQLSQKRQIPLTTSVGMFGGWGRKSTNKTLAHVQSLRNCSFEPVVVVSLPPCSCWNKWEPDRCSVDSRTDFSNGKISNGKTVSAVRISVAMDASIIPLPFFFFSQQKLQWVFSVFSPANRWCRGYCFIKQAIEIIHKVSFCYAGVNPELFY